MTKLYDYEFRPFTIDGDRRVVADERVWEAIRKLGRAGRTGRVRAPVDVFEPWDGPMVDAKDNDLFDCCQCHHRWSADMTDYDPTKRDSRTICQRCKSPGPNQMTMADVRRDLFALIDEFPNLTLMLETSHPENVVGMMPPTLTCQPAYGTCKRLKGHTGGHSQQPEPRPNLWLYARCDTHREADTRILHLLNVPAAVRGLVMEPREAVDLAKWFWAMDGDRRHGRLNQINHVIIRGGAESLHPGNVRSIVRQCETAGVPVWCETPVDGRVVKQLPEAKS